MSGSPHAAEKIGQRLLRLESLLDQAIEDLIAAGSQTACSRCASLLTEAVGELQVLQGLLIGTRHKTTATDAQLEPCDHATLRRQMGKLPPRLQHLERLLAGAAEFYRGWCAAAPLPDGYEADGWSQVRGPALLALEG